MNQGGREAGDLDIVELEYNECVVHLWRPDYVWLLSLEQLALRLFFDL